VKRRQLLQCIPLAALAPVAPLWAASLPRTAANCATASRQQAPYIRASELVLALTTRNLLPAAQAFTAHSQTLVETLHTRPWADCRALWTRSMLAWETLAAVPVSALVERRSVRTVDFWPTRPAQIQALLDAGPERLANPQTQQTIGASAKGLPALEWLLFRKDADASTTALAGLLAEQVLQEARILESAYTTLESTTWDEADAWTAYGEWFSQAVGSLDQLRLKKLKPNTRGKDSAIWVRGVSGQTRAAWQAHARGLQDFFVGPSSAAVGACEASLPIPGSLHSLLLGRRYPQEAAQLQVLVRAMLQSVERAQPEQAASLRAAQQAVANLHRYVSDLGSDLFDFSQGFTDADGD
jgi:predicted lipoprotein